MPTARVHRYFDNVQPILKTEGDVYFLFFIGIGETISGLDRIYYYNTKSFTKWMNRVSK